MTNRELYEHLELDNDGFHYWFMNHDIKSIYDDESTKDIRKIFDKYEKIIDSNSYYIIGNYLYFTFNGNKYYHSPSNFDDERNYIDAIENELKQLGCSDFLYNSGRLD